MTEDEPEISDLSTPVDALDHTRGSRGGRQLVVYGDFECPYTAAAMREVGRLLERGAAFEVVFRHFPLRSIHPHAQWAAQAAEAAARQDRFWEMHDLLFRNQQRLEPADTRRYAERLGLDLERYESDIVDRATMDRVERDLATGLQSRVDGTPSLFIDGRRYEGPRDADSLGRALGSA
ncbi:MAG: formate-nitrite transporter family protein [Chloroflexota bacterium]|jgi:protein-disulfide isomerase|nr:formate-nitrite transporter family protein [Chloroflexota bacterium]